MNTMADWIGFTMALLGAVLVLAGATLIFLHARGQVRPATSFGAEPTVTSAAAPEAAGLGFVRRVFKAVRSMPDADHLIAWGLVLLFLGALAAGAIRFGVAFELGTFNTNVIR
ncbi:MAG: hypothetical protein HOV71_01165 [Hamadaea sp.]|uniref:hypothetical protein n=1 Tax=Hamadaea sp. NPDC050747 TaxID=3155789 RepID=UPI0017C263C4|nr:hypothetical protein [Hamadaea sp.]NUR46720.1 hypothetical protein [Hamadaea sp.]NUT03870.1 hypothetical protein [Hamadaea sp.]